MGKKVGQKRNIAGYTLSEVMVVVAIIGILSAISIPIFHTVEKRDTAEKDAKQLIWDLMWAKQQSIENRKHLKVVFDPAENSYSVLDSYGDVLLSRKLSEESVFGCKGGVQGYEGESCMNGISLKHNQLMINHYGMMGPTDADYLTPVFKKGERTVYIMDKAPDSLRQTAVLMNTLSEPYLLENVTGKWRIIEE